MSYRDFVAVYRGQHIRATYWGKSIRETYDMSATLPCQSAKLTVSLTASKVAAHLSPGPFGVLILSVTS